MHLEHEGCECLGVRRHRDNTRAYGEPFLRAQAELIEQEEADWAYRNLLSSQEPEPPFDTREEARGER